MYILQHVGFCTFFYFLQKFLDRFPTSIDIFFMGDDLLIKSSHYKSLDFSPPMDSGAEQCNFRANLLIGEPWMWEIFDEIIFELSPYPPEGYDSQKSFPENFEGRGDDLVFPYPPGGHWWGGGQPPSQVYFWHFYDFSAKESESEPPYWYLEGEIYRHEYWQKGGKLCAPPLYPGLGALPIFILSFLMLLYGGAPGRAKK
jgi:hypothetical protein